MKIRVKWTLLLYFLFQFAWDRWYKKGLVIMMQPNYLLSESIAKFREDFPVGTKTAFIMMKFDNTNRHKSIFKEIKKTLQNNGITGLRADEKEYSTDLFSNVQTYMHCCDFGIAVFERLTSNDFNPNVSLEVGYMFGLNKKVCLLKDNTLDYLHTDITQRLYKSFDTQRPVRTIKPQLIKWMEDWGFISQNTAKKYDIHYINYENIMKLDSGEPFYREIICDSDNDCFFISIPENKFKDMKKLSPEFLSRENTYFSYNSLETYGEENGINNIMGLIDECKYIVADKWINTLNSGRTLFNGELFGIKKIFSDRSGLEENSKLHLSLYKTDYFTHQVMNTAVRKLKNNSHPISKVNSIPLLNTYYPFMTALGVNTFIKINGTSGKEIVYALRSRHLDNMKNQAKWHVSMNEAVSVTDIQYEKVNLDLCVKRGLLEELGINTNKDYIYENRFHSLFLDTNKFEVGIVNTLNIDINFSNLKSHYSNAKDSALESEGLTSIKFTVPEINKFVSEHNLTDVCKYATNVIMHELYLNT